MAQLCDLKCEPCRTGEGKLVGEQIREYHTQVDRWDVVEEHHITRTFKFKNFVEALDFVNRIGATAEEEGHHPDIYLTWGKVRLELCTHKADGLTASDFILAAKIDRIRR